MLTLLDFKKPGVEDMLLDLQGNEKYAGACDVLSKVCEYTEAELFGECGSVSVLVAMLAEYLRGDAQTASTGTISYLYNLKTQLKAHPLSELTLFELTMFKEMIENIEQLPLRSSTR